MNRFRQSALLNLLRRCRDLVARSGDSAWAGMDRQEIVECIDEAIGPLERSSTVDIEELKLLFAPTGALQETSLDNGWGEEFLVLAGRFDEIVG